MATENKHAEVVSMADMERMSSLSSPSPCLAVLKQRKDVLPNDMKGNWLLLDALADPGNLGTIIRTAEWFGLEGIYCAGDCVELYNPKVVQATMGSIFRQKMVYGSKETILSKAKSAGIRILGASMNGVNAKDFVFEKTDIIVIGNESRGISEDFMSEIKEIISIQGKGRAESLNASVAAGIIMSLL
jgi:TrmH family RNA methyltransferase